jgi:hypothetical protein
VVRRRRGGTRREARLPRGARGLTEEAAPGARRPRYDRASNS